VVDELSVDALIGLSIMEQIKLDILSSEQCVCLNGIKIPHRKHPQVFDNVHCIKVSKSTVLTPRMATKVPVNFIGAEENKLYMTSNAIEMPGVVALDQIRQMNSKSTSFFIENMTDEVITIQEGAVVAH